MKLFTAAVVAALALTAPIPAHADGANFYGKCRIAALNDTTPGGALGGPQVWRGEVDVLVVAKDLGPISATCGITIDGVDQGPILTTPQGHAVIAAAGPLEFTAPVSAIVRLYTTVTTSTGTETCYDFSCDPETPICPNIVCGDGGLLDQVIALLEIPDPVVCAQLVAAAPTVDTLPTAAVLYIDPDTGDTYVGGTTPGDLFWDCPPYVTS